MNIAVTGATGLVGRALISRLINEGYTVHALVRDPNKIEMVHKRLIPYQWDASQLPPPEAIMNTLAVVHLAGENIAGGLWTSARKEKLKSSRVDGCKNLVEGIKTLSPAHRPKRLYTASAVGFYGNSKEKTFTEDSPQGDDFLAHLCQEWESAAQAARTLGTQTVIMRFGLVLSNKGGILKKMGPFVFADGQHFMSWVHINDLVSFIIQSLDKDVQGIYNICSHHPVQQKEFTQTLLPHLKFPFSVPVPRWALKVGLGEMKDTILASQRALPQNLDKIGFRFKYDKLDEALNDLYK